MPVSAGAGLPMYATLARMGVIGEAPNFLAPLSSTPLINIRLWPLALTVTKTCCNLPVLICTVDVLSVPVLGALKTTVLRTPPTRSTVRHSVESVFSHRVKKRVLVVATADSSALIHIDRLISSPIETVPKLMCCWSPSEAARVAIGQL